MEHREESEGELEEENEEKKVKENKENTEDQNNLKLRFPLTKTTQEMMRTADEKRYGEKINFITEYVEGTVCEEHGNDWDSRCPVENDWVYSENVKFAHSTYVPKLPRKLFFRPTTGNCKCRLGYNGEQDMLLVLGCSPNIHKGKKAASLVSMSLLYDFSLEFFETGQTMRGFYRTYKAKCTTKYGMDESELITWQVWLSACQKFWLEVVTMDLKTAYECVKCGKEPPNLIFDGIAMGFQVTLLEKFKKEMNLSAPYASPNMLLGSNFRDRMYVKKYSNRVILKEAAKAGQWPELNQEDINDPDFLVGRKRKPSGKIDSGMDAFKQMLGKLDKSNPPTQGFVKLMQNLSTTTSTTSMFQVVNKTLLHSLGLYLRGSEENNFVRGTNNLNMLTEMRQHYPVMTNIIFDLADSNGHLKKPIAIFLLSLVNHTLSVYDSARIRRNSDYTLRNAELDSQVLPNFPMLRERGNYHKTCQNQDKAAFKNSCEKKFPVDKSLTPGLMVVTCGCPDKVVYGFQMMLTGETPEMVFDMIMSRFPDTYKPNIIYDNSCKLKEFGLNRELSHFMDIQITTNKFHEPNHTACSSAFMSSNYEMLKHVNTEACEQTNSILEVSAA